MPGFVPTVFPESLDIFLRVGGYFTHAIIPAYLINDKNVLEVEEKLRQSEVKWILSSIMPDEFLTPDSHNHFLELAEKLGVYAVVAWDLPTYLERPDEGWENIEKCIDRVGWFKNKGLNVIPLIKGAYEDQIRYCTSRFREMGFGLMAFRATDYMRSDYPPYPELPSESRDPRYLLLKYLKAIFDEGVEKLLLIGGMNPKYFDDFLDISENIVFAGASWYLDSLRYTVHLFGEKRYVGNRYYECDCPACKYTPSRVRRSPEHIALHNLHIDRMMNDEREEPYEIRFHDLIVDDFEDVVIAGNLFVGKEHSLWREFIEKMRSMRPSYMVLAGNIIYPEYNEWARNEWRGFIEEVLWFWEDNGTITFFMRGYHELKPMKITDSHRLLYGLGEDPLTSKKSSEDYILSILRYYNTAKRRLDIKKITATGEGLSIYVEPLSIDDIQTLEHYIDLFEAYRKRLNRDWIITTVKPYPHIDYERRVAILGEWREKAPYLEKPRPGYIHITHQGEVKLVKIEEG